MTDSGQGGPRDDGDRPPRFVPDVPFPRYSYVPGHSPHPVRDPQGHSFGHVAPEIDPPDETTWPECRAYLRGIDLFNHGFYWEAHEAWEGVWLALGRRGPRADFIKGLIKLAAAGVKARAGSREGTLRHARRAAELFAGVAAAIDGDPPRCLGLDLAALQELATHVARETAPAVERPDPSLRLTVQIVPDFPST